MSGREDGSDIVCTRIRQQMMVSKRPQTIYPKPCQVCGQPVKLVEDPKRLVIWVIDYHLDPKTGKECSKSLKPKI